MLLISKIRIGEKMPTWFLVAWIGLYWPVATCALVAMSCMSMFASRDVYGTTLFIVALVWIIGVFAELHHETSWCYDVRRPKQLP